MSCNNSCNGANTSNVGNGCSNAGSSHGCGSGYVILIVLYILLAIILGSYIMC